MNTTLRNLTRRMRTAMLCLATIGLAQQAYAQSEVLRTGKLPNGLTYYIYNDGSTPGEAQFYLYQNVGAVNEADNQTGLAHALEHLAFNATDNFPGGVMAFLKANGLTDFEAFTGVDDTRYAVHNVPTANTQLMGKMYLLLKDWCHGIKIQPADVEKERGIIMEEWRRREGIDRRITDSTARVMYNYSKYAYRNVIGNEARLRSFTPKDVRTFYDTWYRPQLQFVAIIGDVNLDQAERTIKATLSSLPKKATPYDAELRKIGDNAQPLYMQFVDKENKSPSFGLYQRVRLPNNPNSDEGTRNFLFTRIFNTLAPRRFARLKNADAETFIAASVSLSPLVRGFAQVAWDVVPYANNAHQAMQQLLDVRGAIASEGFSSKEFEAEKSEIYQGMKDALEAKGLGTPDNVFNLMKQNFLYGTPISDFREQIQRNIEVLVEQEVEDFNAWVAKLLDHNNLAFITYERKPNELDLSEGTFLAALKSSETPSIGVAPDNTLTKLDLSHIVAGKIVSEKAISKLAAKEWKLSNGARVIYKYLPQAKGMLFFSATAPGGRAAVTPQQLPSYMGMRNQLMQTGVGGYNRNQLASWLQGKDIDLTMSPGDYSDDLSGSVPVAQADNFFGYLNLILSRHDFSSNVFSKYVQRSKYLYANRSLEGIEAAQDSIRQLLFPPSEANPEQDEAFFDRMQFNELPSQFFAHFGNAARYTYFIVGDMPEVQAKNLVTRYLASLKGDPKQTLPAPTAMNFASKEPLIKRTFNVEMQGDLAEIELSFANNLRLTDKERAAFQVMRGILETKYFDELREKQHLTYTVGVKADYVSEPETTETLSIHLSTARASVATALAQVNALLDDVRLGKFSADEFKAAVVPLAVDEQTPASPEMATNPMLWMATLGVYAQTGETITPEESAAVDPIFSTLTPADVSAVAAKVLNNAVKREIVVQAIVHEGKLS